jgi:hypothetical protein
MDLADRLADPLVTGLTGVRLQLVRVLGSVTPPNEGADEDPAEDPNEDAGWRRRSHMDFDEEVAAAAVPDVELIRLALDTLRQVTADGQWFAGRRSDADREASRHAVDVVAGVLAGHLANCP